MRGVVYAASNAAPPRAVISAARGWLGTPYHDQASLKGVGCDCLGLIRGVWREVVGPEPLEMPPYSRGWGEMGRHELLIEAARGCMVPSGLVAGAVVVLRMRAGAIAKHAGILTGNATFIHSYERLGVCEVAFTTAWRRRVAASFLMPGRAMMREDG